MAVIVCGGVGGAAIASSALAMSPIIAVDIDAEKLETRDWMRLWNQTMKEPR